MIPPMRVRLSAWFGLLWAGFLVMSNAKAHAQCALRYNEAFVRLPALGLRALDSARAGAEVSSLFGPQPESCEAGAYQRFVDAFRDYARAAMRADPKDRDGMLRVAIPVISQAPRKVPFQESKAVVTIFRQARSDLHATADDVGITPLMQQLLYAFEQKGPPQSLPPPPLSQGDPTAQAIRVPTTPLPPWAVISLYEMRELLRQQNHAAAQRKLEDILRWMETPQ